MKINMGLLDRLIRIVVALVVGYLYYTDVISGTLAVVLLIVAGIFVLTSLFGVCPIYRLIGVRTCSRKD